MFWTGLCAYVMLQLLREASCPLIKSIELQIEIINARCHVALSL